MRLIKHLTFAALLPLLTGSCTILPRIAEKPVAKAMAAPSSGLLAGTSRVLASGRTPGDSSFLLLDDAGEALKWRLALIDSARSSIDIQLYLWHGGASGVLLFERALQAADRGVRVRLLVDDFLLTAGDAELATLSRNHPNFELRIFNPGRVRGGGIGGLTGFLANFKELNRRMHNKTFTVDGTMTIVGGRNIGDHYYGMDENYNFIDLDVLAEGPVVAEVSAGFDEFWNSSGAYPGEFLSNRNDPEAVESARAGFRETLATESHGRLRGYPVTRHDWSREFATLPKRMVTGRARFLQDDPEPGRDRRLVVSSVTKMADSQKGELLFCTPYLLPADSGMESLKEMIGGGMNVRVLVPSLAANNQALVHGHYHLIRRKLVDSGCGLSEFRADPTEQVRALADVGPVRSERVALHLKAVVGDRRKCFVGSLNLDPRALKINTESGLLIESPELAGELGALVDTLSDERNSWRVSRDERGGIEWRSRGETRHHPPPARWRARLLSWLSGLLPIKDQL